MPDNLCFPVTIVQENRKQLCWSKVQQSSRNSIKKP